MNKVCEKCGKTFEIWPGVLSNSRRKYCDKCSRKINLPTQAELAKRAGREFVDRVQIETDKADAENLSYGQHMARKEQGK